MTEVNIKLLNDYAKIPTSGSPEAAGLDLYVASEERIMILPHATVKVPTGIAMEIPEGYFGAVYPRSGLATKQGLRLANCVAVIDSDYRGEILVPIYNDSDHTRYIEPNDRVAQMVIQPYLKIKLNQVSDLSETIRGDGGFGSTGSK